MTDIQISFVFDKVLVGMSNAFRLSCTDVTGKQIYVWLTTKHDHGFSLPDEGECFTATGHWTERPHPNNPYSIMRQFNTTELTPTRLTGRLTNTLFRFVDGIGEKTAQKIVDSLGGDLTSVLCDKSQFNRLVKCIDPRNTQLAKYQALLLYEKFDESEKVNLRNCQRLNFFRFLDTEIGAGVSKRVANSIFSMLGEPETFDTLLRNPYIAAGMTDWTAVDIFGKKVLRYKAQKDGLKLEGKEEREHPERLLGAVFEASKRLLDTGDSWFTQSEFISTVKPLLDRGAERLSQDKRVNPFLALNLAVERGLILDIGEGRLQHLGPNHMESLLAAFVARSDASPSHVKPPSGWVLSRLLSEAKSNTLLNELTDEQDFVIREILKGNFNLLQGAAGTGKTSVMRILVNVWKRIGGRVIMCALAGKAALELTQSVKTETASTIAQLLHGLDKLAGDDKDYGKCLEKGIKEDEEYLIPGVEQRINGSTLLIIDEASMVDTITLKTLLNLIPAQVKILLVGDHHQLPPIGWGQPFHDLVANCPEKLNVLTKVLRQGSDSPIPMVAQSVKDGFLPGLEPWSGQTEGVFSIDEVENPNEILNKEFGQEWLRVVALNDTVEKFNEESKPQADIMKIILGELKDQFIPDHNKQVAMIAGTKVICTRNRRSEGLFNGMIGVIESIHGKSVMVKWDAYSEPRELSVDAWFDIKPAYAITVHKSQGSSAPAVVVVLEDTRLLNRQWLYTAITRAKRLVLIQKPNSIVFDNKLEKRLSAIANRRTNFKPIFDNQSMAA